MTIEIFGRPLRHDQNKNLALDWRTFKEQRPGLVGTTLEWMLELDWGGLSFYVRSRGVSTTVVTYRYNFENDNVKPEARDVDQIRTAILELLGLMKDSEVVVAVATAQTKGFVQNHVREVS